MTIEQAYDFVAELVSKYQLGDYSDDGFNEAARQSQLDAIKDRFLAYQSKTASLTAIQEISSVLKTVPLTVTTVSGAAIVPINTVTDYLYLDSLSYVREKQITRIARTTICNVPVSNTTTTTNVPTEIIVVAPNALVNRGNDLIAPADLEYPIAAWDNLNRLSILPLTMSGKVVNTKYYSIPPAPSITSSVDFTLPESTHTELCIRIIRYLSVMYQSTTLAELTKILL